MPHSGRDKEGIHRVTRDLKRNSKVNEVTQEMRHQESHYKGPKASRAVRRQQKASVSENW